MVPSKNNHHRLYIDKPNINHQPTLYGIFLVIFLNYIRQHHVLNFKQDFQSIHHNFGWKQTSANTTTATTRKHKNTIKKKSKNHQNAIKNILQSTISSRRPQLKPYSISA